jgi:hypothetical protein
MKLVRRTPAPLLFADTQMSEYLLYHRLLVNEADDTHLTGALRASKVDLPDKRRLRTFLMCPERNALGVHSRHIRCGIRFGL